MFIKHARNGFFAALALSAYAFAAFSAQASQPQATQEEAPEAVTSDPSLGDVTDDGVVPLTTTCKELKCYNGLICKDNCYPSGNACCTTSFTLSQ